MRIAGDVWAEELPGDGAEAQIVRTRDDRRSGGGTGEARVGLVGGHDAPPTDLGGVGEAASLGGRSVRMTSTAAILAGDLTFGEWIGVGQRLQRLNEAAAWWLGDWLVYGEWCYGAKYRTAVAQLGLSYDRLRDYAYVAGNVPRAIRRADLGFYHHRLVAKLDPDLQREWLRRAAEAKWTKRQLEQAIAGSVPHPVGSAERRYVRLPIDGARLGEWERAAGVETGDLQRWMIETLDRAAATIVAGRHPGPEIVGPGGSAA